MASECCVTYILKVCLELHPCTYMFFSISFSSDVGLDTRKSSRTSRGINLKNLFIHVTFLEDQVQRVYPLSTHLNVAENECYNIYSIVGKTRSVKFDNGKEYDARIVLISDSKEECYKSKVLHEKNSESNMTNKSLKRKKSSLDNTVVQKKTKHGDADRLDIPTSLVFPLPKQNHKDLTARPKQLSYHLSDTEDNNDDISLDPDFAVLNDVNYFSDTDSLPSSPIKKKRSLPSFKPKKLTILEKVSKPKTQKSLPSEKNAQKKARESVLDKQADLILKEQEQEEDDNKTKLAIPVALYITENEVQRFKIEVKDKEIKIGKVRNLIEEKLETMHNEFILLFWKGKLLKDNDQQLLEHWDGKGEVFVLKKETSNKESEPSDASSSHFNQSTQKTDTVTDQPIMKTSSHSQQQLPPVHTEKENRAEIVHMGREIHPNDNTNIASPRKESNAAPPTVAFAIPQGSRDDKIILNQLARLEGKVDTVCNSLQLITDVLERVASCRSCIKGVLKVIKESSVSSSKSLPSAATPTMPDIKALPETPKSQHKVTQVSTPVPISLHSQQSAPASPVIDPPPQCESIQDKQLQSSSHNDNANQQVPLFDGSSVMVNKERLNDTKGSTPSLYATKLFELIFTWDEAKASSTSGKGTDPKTKEKLKKLDEKRLETMRIHIRKKFGDIEWKPVLASIDTKCRGVRSNKYGKW